MSILDQTSVLILTYNEAPNIGRTLDALERFTDIVIVDSGSTDATLEIIARYPQARVVHRPFDDFASQCNFGLTRVTTKWVLSLDADYVLSDALVAELSALAPDEHTAGFQARFTYCIYGRPLRGSLYPPRTVLYQKARARYHNEGHGHRVAIEGRLKRLIAPILHDDHKPLARWLYSQQLYARLEADHLLATPAGDLGRAGRLRLMAWLAPFLVFLYTLVAKRCLLDGWPGWFYAFQRLIAELMIALEVLDRRLGGRTRSS